MRDYTNTDRYLNKLLGDVYPQPEGGDEHENLSRKVIFHWMSRLSNCKSVLDLGCGEGMCQSIFESLGASYEGVCLGDDYYNGIEKGRNVKKMDFSFLEYPDDNFDLLFSRHSLEHSPAPLLSLMEWNRVSRQWLGLVVPAPEWYGYGGRNHYYVLHIDQWINLLDKSGWNVIWNETDSLPKDSRSPEIVTPHEYWLFCEKKRG